MLHWIFVLLGIILGGQLWDVVSVPIGCQHDIVMVSRASGEQINVSQSAGHDSVKPAGDQSDYLTWQQVWTWTLLGWTDRPTNSPPHVHVARLGNCFDEHSWEVTTAPFGSAGAWDVSIKREQAWVPGPQPEGGVWEDTPLFTVAATIAGNPLPQRCVWSYYAPDGTWSGPHRCQPLVNGQIETVTHLPMVLHR